MKKILEFILQPWVRWKRHRDYKRKIKMLRKRDPYIYK